MSGIVLLLIAIVALVIAYITYGSWLAKKWGIDPSRKTPAHEFNDGKDYVPTKAPVLLGHHFSSIAGAGPINGPILAAIFGWVPVFLWLVIGGIFIGAVQDFSALFASARHKGQSIGIVISANVGRRAKKMFIVFAYLALLLVIAAFANIVAVTFNAFAPDGTLRAGAYNAGVAASVSALFMGAAVIFGFLIYRRQTPFWLTTIVGVAMVAIVIAIGMQIPIYLSTTVWMLLVGVYIFIASVSPVWVLLQPRDLLTSFLLYAMLIAAIIGIFSYNPTINLAPFYGFRGIHGTNFLFPMLFIMVACGAVSGFHSLVSSGTTAKMLDNEKDTKIIGYGGMLIETCLAVIALITIGFLSTRYTLATGTPMDIFASGLAQMITPLGGGGEIFSTVVWAVLILCVSAFALTSVDTATRLARYMFAEFFLNEGETRDTVSGLKKVLINPYFGTGVTVVLGISLGMGGFAIIWPLFGAANQLLGGLALLAVAAWLGNIGRDKKMFIIPVIFMLTATLTALVIIIVQHLTLIVGGTINLPVVLRLVFAAVMVYLAFTLVVEGVQTFKKQARGEKTGIPQ